MNHKELMEKDNMVKSRVSNTLVRRERKRRTDEKDKRAASLKGLKEVPKDPLHYS